MDSMFPQSNQQPPTKRRKLSAAMPSGPCHGLLTPELRSRAKKAALKATTTTFTSLVKSLSASAHSVHAQHLALCYALRNIPMTTAPSIALVLVTKVLLVAPHAMSSKRYFKHLVSSLYPFAVKCQVEELTSFLVGLACCTRTSMLSQFARSARLEHVFFFNALFTSLKKCLSPRQATRILPACSGSVVRLAVTECKTNFTNDISWRLLCRRRTKVIEELLFDVDGKDVINSKMWRHSLPFMPPSAVLTYILSAKEIPREPLKRNAFTHHVLRAPNALHRITSEASEIALRALFPRIGEYGMFIESCFAPTGKPGPSIATLLHRATHHNRLSLLRRLRVVFTVYENVLLATVMRTSRPSLRTKLLSVGYPNFSFRYAQRAVISLLPAPARYLHVTTPKDNASDLKQDIFF